jgi:hypothetical protein
VMRSPALLSDMVKKCARPSAGARMNTSRGFFNYISKRLERSTETRDDWWVTYGASSVDRC